MKKFYISFTYTNVLHMHVYAHTMDYYSAIKNEEVLLLVAARMNLEGIMLSKRNQRESLVILLIC